MKYCARCIQSDSRPGITINSDGICSACEGHAEKIEINWDAREKELAELFAKFRGTGKQNYDCIVPVSGGKDSTYQTWVVKEKYGMNPLCVTYRTPLRTPLGQRNLDNLQARLKVDLLELSVSPATERKFILKAIKQLGVPGLPQHMGIFAFTLRMAVKLGIPLIVWGENAQLEYGGTKSERANRLLDRAWLVKHGCLHETTAQDWVDSDLSAQELLPFEIPSDQEFKESGVNSFFLGSFLKWDPYENAQIAKGLGFEFRAEGPVIGTWNYADLDCYLIGIHHYVKWLKFGITRAFDNVAVDIRQGRITKAEGLRLIRERGEDLPPPDHLEKSCDFLGLSQAGLMEILESFRNPEIWKQQSDGNWVIPGFLEGVD